MKFNVSDVTNTVITGLKPARTYTVAVRAYTQIGPGPLGTNKSKTTNESRKYYRNSGFRMSTALHAFVGTVHIHFVFEKL